MILIYLHKRIKWILTVSLVQIFIVGCGGDSSNDNTGTVSSFNLSALAASDSDVKTVRFTWTSASDNSGTTYHVCEKNSSSENECNLLSTVADTLTESISVSSLADAITNDYFIMATDGSGNVSRSNEQSLSASTVSQMIGYFKASNTEENDGFGRSVSLSKDGTMLAVGVPNEDSALTGVITDGREVADVSSAPSAGAVYLFGKESNNWKQIAYIKPSNTSAGDEFGQSVSFTDDGSTLAVGSPGEDNSVTGVFTDGSEVTDVALSQESGAVYLFSRESGSWRQVAYVKASNAGAYDRFGFNVVISGDGSTMAASSGGEDNGVSGIITDGSEVTDSGFESGSGAVYLFRKNVGNWQQTAYVKPSNTDTNDWFGYSIDLSQDGTTMVVAARDEDNSAKGIITDGSEVSDIGLAAESGAVYVFRNAANTWSQMAYIKASNTESGDQFGKSLSLSADGATLAVGAPNEDNGLAGIVTDGSEVLDSGSAPSSGAVYLFRFESSAWSPSAYIKASNTGSNDYFGSSVALSEDGKVLAVGAYGESNGVSGVIVDGSEVIETESAASSGAVYLFKDLSSEWKQTSFIKASNPGAGDFFGDWVALSSDATTLAVGAINEDNAAKGIISDGSESMDDGVASNSGAVYLY
ncbi:hypothetical protein BA953_03190 [Vibrio coralliilyticus]|uniref:hypothetical protein n=1 Tax=Vibrio coralliilyticus TaxID=190893 RepID=UPI000810552F|nr:hypothetical protein [Vibrio coralliilyticus]ANW23289.1 hypothetical protein BA953_03190 [Vibrio coralliilyticus]